MKLIGIFLSTLLMAAAVSAQRPRPVDTSEPTDATKATPPPAPQTMPAKYEGGIIGHNKALDGTLSFDDTNQRLLFRKNQKDLFFIPYNAVISAFSDTQKKQPGAATVAQHVPLVGGAIGMIKTKVRYLTLQFRDPDTQVSGVTSFKLADKDLVDSVAYTLANKAGLVPRGDVYVRKAADTEAKKTTP